MCLTTVPQKKGYILLKAINNSSSMTRIPYRHILMYIDLLVYTHQTPRVEAGGRGCRPNKCLFEMAFSILKCAINQPLSICKCLSFCVCTSLDILLYSLYIFWSPSEFLFISFLLGCSMANVHKNIFLPQLASLFRIF